MELATVNPQTNFKLLNTGANNYISYLVRVTPPALVYKTAKELDGMMEQARTDALTLVECMNHPQADFDEELDRATKLACLPIRDGGMGHCTAVDRSPPRVHCGCPRDEIAPLPLLPGETVGPPTLL